MLQPATSTAQRPTVWIDALASTARPPAVVNGRTGIYGLLGGRAGWELPRSSLSLAGYLGTGTRPQDGRWGAFMGTAGHVWRRGALSGAVDADVLALRYTDPVPYSAATASLRPSLSFPLRRFGLSAFADLGFGGWTSTPAGQLALPDSLQEDNSGSLTVAGIGATVATGLANGALSLSGRVLDATNGSIDGLYRSLTLEISQESAGWDLGADATALRGPGFTETGIALRAGRSVGSDLYVAAEIAQLVSDPVLGSRGHRGVTLSASWRPGRRPAAAPPPEPVVEIGPREGEGLRVQFRLRDVTAAEVALVGSFTEWKPQPMRRITDGWELSVVLPAGSYQFAFLLDGKTWYLPKDAPGVVEDGFGRSNATIVVGSVVTPAPL